MKRVFFLLTGGAFLALTLLIAALAVNGIYQLERLQTQMDTVVELHNRKIETVTAIQVDALARADRLLRMAIERDPFSRDELFLEFNRAGFLLLGQHRWRSKVLVYEESIRVPLLLRLPPPAGGQPSRVWHIALNNDLAPTIADLAGVEPGLAVDGRSLLPALGDALPRWRRRFLVEYPPAGETRCIPPFFAVREGTAAHWERVLYAETLDFAGSRVTDREQYDLVRDPFQQRSLHRDDSPRRVAQRRLLGGGSTSSGSAAAALARLWKRRDRCPCHRRGSSEGWRAASSHLWNNTCDTLINLRKNKNMTTTWGNIYHDAMR